MSHAAPGTSGGSQRALRSLNAPPGPPPGRPPMSMNAIAPPGPPPGGPGGVAAHMYQIPLQGYPGISIPMTFAPPPAAMPNFPPPLPPGWSEHRAPDGVTPYFYNSQTKESTYTRPSFAPLPSSGGGTEAVAVGAAGASNVSATDNKKKKKKEKPKDKVPIPGTTWTRVTTTEGNVFYFEKESKRSEWTVPEEISEAVRTLEMSEREEKESREHEEQLELQREQERVRAEVDQQRRRVAALAEERKRKSREEASDGDRDTKLARKDSKGSDTEKDEEEYAPQGKEDEEEWMKAVAAEFAEADKVAAAKDAREKEQAAKDEEEAAKKVFAAPEKVKVSPEEGRALFKALLIEKNISPFSPWDQSLPLFINDPRYVLLPSMKDRREVFEEYCRDAGRARRLNKSVGASATSTAGLLSDKRVDPDRDYRALLRDEVTSTRTRWDDFRRKWKRDRRFYSFGRDDREREKGFKVHLRELGERKRADAQRIEIDFFELLKETTGIQSDSVWSQVKRGISSDARYDAVGSSSLREELFGNFVKKISESEGRVETVDEVTEKKLNERRDRQAASLRERAAKVREHQAKVTEDVDKSRAGAGREEAERLYGSLLVDVVRDHDATWNVAFPILGQDPRFAHPSLGLRDKQRIFEQHVARLGAKKSNALHQLFATHAPDLNTPYDIVYSKIVDDPLLTRLSLVGDALYDRFSAWRRLREQEARQEFDVMLSENSFVEFWGRMRKKEIDESAAAVKEDVERDEGEGLGEGGAADITALAKQIDLEEVKSVLRRDKRYRQFDHIPEIREEWLRNYLENLEGSKGSETIHQVGHL